MLKDFVIYYRLHSRIVESENGNLYPWLFSLFSNMVFAFALYDNHDRNFVLKIVPLVLLFLSVVVVLVEKGSSKRRIFDIMCTTPISVCTVSCLNIVCRVFSRDMLRWYILNIFVFITLGIPWELIGLYFCRIFILLSFIPLLEYMLILKATVRISHVLFIAFFYFTLKRGYFTIPDSHFDSFIFLIFPVSLVFHMLFVNKLLAVSYNSRGNSNRGSKIYDILYVFLVEKVHSPTIRTIISLFFRDRNNLYDFIYMSLFIFCYTFYLYSNGGYRQEFCVM